MWWDSPYINHFIQPDTIIPNPANPQSWNRYSYVLNNPILFNDPSGHAQSCEDGDVCRHPSPTLNLPANSPGGGGGGEKCNNDPDCELGGGHGDGGTGPVVVDPLIWSSGNYTSQFFGNFFSFQSTQLQHAANFFSYLGAFSEIGFTTAGLLFGSAAVGWVDLGFPIADVTGGLAGGLVGWEVGHAIHFLITNPIESGLSNASTIASFLSDLSLGNNRVDLYSSHATGVVGQSTATSLALTFVGDMSTTGIADAAIDQLGSWYSDGKIGGVYDLFGITGTTIPIASAPTAPFVSIQFGDK